MQRAELAALARVQHSRRQGWGEKGRTGREGGIEEERESESAL